MSTFSLVCLAVGVIFVLSSFANDVGRTPMKLTWTWGKRKSIHYVNQGVGLLLAVLWVYFVFFALPFITIALLGLVFPAIQITFVTWLVALAVFWLTGLYRYKR